MDWKKIVMGVAPAIGTALLGPAGGVAIATLGKTLLGDANASEEAVAQAVMSMPSGDLALKLREEENRYKLEVERNAIEQSRVNLENTRSARNMYVDKDGPQVKISYIIIIGFFLITIATFSLFAFGGKDLPKESSFLIGTLVGSLGTYVMTVVKFWFGGKPDDEQNMDRIYNAIPSEVKK